MTTMEEEVATSIVKADRIGRTRYTARYKAEVIEAFAASGLSGPVFARQCGIKYPTFAAWAAKSRREGRPRQAAQATSSFIVAEIGQEVVDGSGALEIQLPGGARALAGTPRQIVLLAELLKALG